MYREGEKHVLVFFLDTEATSHAREDWKVWIGQARVKTGEDGVRTHKANWTGYHPIRSLLHGQGEGRERRCKPPPCINSSPPKTAGTTIEYQPNFPLFMPSPNVLEYENSAWVTIEYPRDVSGIGPSIRVYPFPRTRTLAGGVGSRASLDKD